MLLLSFPVRVEVLLFHIYAPEEVERDEKEQQDAEKDEAASTRIDAGHTMA